MQRIRMEPHRTRQATCTGNPAILYHPKRDGQNGNRRKTKKGARCKTAIEITCSIDGDEEFQTAIKKLESAMQNRIHRHLSSWTEEIKAEATRTVPVRTGHLRNTIYATVKEWVVNLGADATYASFVELGTRYMRAQPYLCPALQRHLPQLESTIVAAIDQAKSEANL